jgi:hypothetical protein
MQENLSMRVLRHTLLIVVILSFLCFRPAVSWGIIALRHDLEVEGFLQAENILSANPGVKVRQDLSSLMLGLAPSGAAGRKTPRTTRLHSRLNSC